jgi:phosphohistidine phosphatase
VKQSPAKVQLLLVRHGDAGDSEKWAAAGKPDADRPLSEKGRQQLKRCRSVLARLVSKVDLIATSPYTRALETTDLLFEDTLKGRAYKITDSLLPDAEPDDFVRWLRAQRPRDVIAAVGHEPQLSILATWLIAGIDESRLRLRKGGACLIQLGRRPGKGQGTLEWLLGPRQMR